MFLNPDLPAHCRRTGSGMRWMAVTLAALLAACGAIPSPFSKAPDAAAQRAAQSATTADTPASASPASNPVTPPPPAAPPAPDTVARMLTYAERVRLMPPAELNQEALRLAAPGEATAPGSQVQLSLVLSQLRQLPELIRAQELLARVLANAGAEAQPLHPLARLLAFRYGEQRRLEEQLEKERQQTREVQRRLDQTNERLEALKAIERSLTARPPAPPAPVPAPATSSAPASRGRAATP